MPLRPKGRRSACIDAAAFQAGLVHEHSGFARGFTLVEVLVALAIVAFGLTALFTTTNQTARASGYLREKTLAEWIALNRITETRLAGQVPTDEKQTGKTEYAGQTWRWELETIQTPVPGIVRLEARVALASNPTDSWSALATGFMDKGMAAGGSLAPPPAFSLDWHGTGPPGPRRSP
jgi:general secretion pathway protein I